MQLIKNIIFDIGNTIIDIQFDMFIEKLKKFSVNNIQEKMNIFERYIYPDFSTGKISSQTFRTRTLQIFQLNINDALFDELWCSLLSDIDPNITFLIKKLSERYNIYVLSNTDPIHTKYFRASDNWPEVFKKEYYSFEIGFIKPQKAIYKYVIDNARILPCQTIFIDDKIENLKSAETLGFVTKQVDSHFDTISFISQLIDN